MRLKKRELKHKNKVKVVNLKTFHYLYIKIKPEEHAFLIDVRLLGTL